MFREKSSSEKMRYLYDTFSTSMFAVANRILKDSHMAEDVVQEVLIRIFRADIMEKLNEMDEPAIRKYLLITTKNIAINFYVKRKKETGITIADYNEEVLNSIPVEDSAEIAIRKMEEEKVLEMVNSMSEKYSYVLLAKYRYELSDKQIATQCGITETTVRKRLERGRKMLKDKLNRRHYLDYEY